MGSRRRGSLSADEAAKNIPVIAVTASAFGDTRKAARDAGCVEYLPKPVRAEALFAALQKHLGVEFVWETEGEPPATRRHRLRRRIMPASPRSCARRRRSARSPIFMRSPARWPAADDGDADLGRRIGALAASFDFDGVRQLAAALGRRARKWRCVLTAPRSRPFSSSTTPPPICRCWYARCERTGHRILAAKDGPTALEIAQAHATGPDAARRDDAGHGRLRSLQGAEVGAGHPATSS